MHDIARNSLQYSGRRGAFDLPVGMIATAFAIRPYGDYVSEKELRIELDRADVRLGEVVQEVKAARELASMAVGHPNRPDNNGLRIHLDLAERRLKQVIEALNQAREEVVNKDPFEGGAHFTSKTKPGRLRAVKPDKSKV